MKIRSARHQKTENITPLLSFSLLSSFSSLSISHQLFVCWFHKQKYPFHEYFSHPQTSSLFSPLSFLLLFYSPIVFLLGVSPISWFPHTQIRGTSSFTPPIKVLKSLICLSCSFCCCCCCFCFVIFCCVMICYVLSCFIMFYFILFYFILFIWENRRKGRERKKPLV